jgi:hypothetical protein
MNHTELDLETLRVRIYAELASDGRVADRSTLATQLGVREDAIGAALADLARARHLVLDPAGEIELAHPFGTRDFGFSARSSHTLWWGGCAWDSFAIPHLVPGASPTLIATTCPACGSAHAWDVTSSRAPDGAQVAHFLVPMAQVWDDVIHACENQRIFCSEACVDDLLERTGEHKGTVFGLSTLWKLASDWYTGRLEYGYQRRQPEEAAEYFRGAGLEGAFWGNAPAGDS